MKPNGRPPVVSNQLIKRLGNQFQLKGRRVQGLWVEVAPHPAATRSNCDANVAAQIRDYGGEPHYVWDAGETGPFLELEAHVIWKGSDGKLLDVSPSLVGATRHYVFPAAEKFERPFPGNLVVPLVDNENVRHIAVYLTMAHAVLAPHRKVGPNVFTRPNLQIWISEFLNHERVSADPVELLQTCLTVIQGWNRTMQRNAGMRAES